MTQSSKHQLPTTIGKPAYSALQRMGYGSLEHIDRLTDKQLLQIHGVGPKAIRLLRIAIKDMHQASINTAQTP